MYRFESGEINSYICSFASYPAVGDKRQQLLLREKRGNEDKREQDAAARKRASRGGRGAGETGELKEP